MSRFLAKNIEQDHIAIKPNVLIVDDEEAITDILQTYVSMSGCRADVSLTGKDAMGKVQKTTYDLVLLDINLPDIEGTELITRIQRFLPDIKIVVMTGENTREKELQARQYNIFYYLVKPFSLNELRGLLFHLEKRCQEDILPSLLQ